MKSILLPILPLLQRLEQAGYEAYAVGGCVRDALLGRVPKDFDLTTNALPSQIQAVFCDCTVLPTGINHGTVTVLWEGVPTEITTYRTDGDYSDSRHPDSVSFTASLTEDLARRDFTVNAIAANSNGILQDPYGGRQDLQQGILRAVGEPSLRFCEDALRILRLWRFACVLGFTIDEQTQKSALALAPRLQYVAKERILTELSKGIAAAHFSTLLQNPLTYAVIAQIAPSLCPALDTGALSAQIDAIPSTHPRCFALRFALFCHRASLGAAAAQQLLCSLKADNQTQKIVFDLLDALQSPPLFDRISLKRRLCAMGAQRCLDWLLLYSALSEEDTTSTMHTLRDILKRGECYSLANLAIGGADLLSLGMQPGPHIGQMLHTLLEQVLQELVPNEKEALLALALTMLPEQ